MSNIDPKARTWAEIDMAALKHNFEIAKRTGKKVLCVIKANAYGHGAVHCGLFLEKQGADFFAVACLSEAIELREGGITKPILILGYTPEKYAEMLAKYDITQAVQDERTALEFGRYATEAGVNLNVHVKIDTGMSRTGIFAQGEEAALAAADTIERIYNIPGITVRVCSPTSPWRIPPPRTNTPHGSSRTTQPSSTPLQQRGCARRCATPATPRPYLPTLRHTLTWCARA